MRVEVQVDDREPTGVVRSVRNHPDVRACEVTRLVAADIAVQGIGVERKTPRDYVRSAIGPRGTDLDAQAGRLLAAYDRAYLLVEGTLVGVEGATGLDPTAVRGSMASLMARYGLPVVPCGDRERLVDLAIRLGRKHREPPSPRALPSGAVPDRDAPPAKRMYGCIEGVGPELAERLYRTFPSVAALAEASVEDIQGVEGFGEKRARDVYESLR